MPPPETPTPEPPPVVDPNFATEPPDLASEDVPCLNCGYNLRGLDENGTCPECGVPIDRSLHGNLLIYSSPDYVASLYQGVTLIIAGVIATIGIIFASIIFTVTIGILTATGTTIPDTQLFSALMTTAGSAITLLLLIGWWMFSMPDPAVLGVETGNRARTIIRVTVIVSVAMSILQAILEIASVNATPQAMGLMDGSVKIAALVAMAIKFFAAMMYLRWLAPRLTNAAIDRIAPRQPNSEIDRIARRFMWLIPLLVVFSLCSFYITTLIAMIMYIRLLNRVRVDLRSIRERQAQEAVSFP